MKTALERINHGNPLLKLAELGFSPAQVKELIVETLGPFMENHAILHELAVEQLAIEGANVGRISTTLHGLDYLECVIRLYRAAYSTSPGECFAVIAAWEERIQSSVREFWNQCLFEVDKEDLDLEHFRYECFRNIGVMTEACLQPYLREGLSMDRLSKGRSLEDAGTDRQNLGVVAAELHQSLANDAILAPPPWGLRVSVWRNIAQHHSSKVAEGRIEATYGKRNPPDRIVFDRAELLEVLCALQLRLSVFKSARTLFIFDHFDELKNVMLAGELGEASVLLQVSSALATQGFEVSDTTITVEEAIFVLRDMQPGCNHGRIAHCSQFLVTIWRHYRRKMVAIYYKDSNGVLRTKMEADGTDMERITADGKIDWEHLANCIRFKHQ